MVEVATPARAATSPIESSVSVIRVLDLNSGSSVNLDRMTNDAMIPNHHRDYPGFSGPSGLLAAASMAVGRGGDARVAADLGQVGRDDVVVDIGCGPGAAARYAARLGASVTGVDPAPVMLRGRPSAQRWSNATLIAPERSWVASATNGSRQFSSSGKVCVSIPVRSTRPSPTRSR